MSTQPRPRLGEALAAEVRPQVGPVDLDTLTRPIGILLIADSGILRAGLSMLLGNQPGLVVVGEATSCANALSAATVPPDIIVFDLDPGRELDGVPDLLVANPGARLLMLTSKGTPATYSQAAQLGAMGVVLKEKPAEVLIKAIMRVHAGEAWFDRCAIGAVLAGMRYNRAERTDVEADKMAQVTKREREVVTLVAEGMRNKSIATRLFISEVTVRHHLTSILQKLEVADRLELMIYAFRHGMATPPLHSSPQPGLNLDLKR